MTNYARIISNVAVDVSTDPQNHFVPSLAAEFTPVPDSVQPQWRLVGGAWQPPPPPPDVPPPVVPDADQRVTRLAFLSRFTSAERIAIRASTDPATQDFMQLLDAATWIDLARQDTQQGVEYLVSQTLLTQDRATAILNDPIQPLERPAS